MIPKHDREHCKTTIVVESPMDATRLFDALYAAVLLEKARCDISLAELARTHLRGSSASKPKNRIVLAELFKLRRDAYSPQQERSRRACDSARRFFESRLGPDAVAASLDDTAVDVALSGIANPVSWNSLFRRLCLVLNWSVRQGLLEKSPLCRLGPKPVPWREPSFFLPDRVERIMRATEKHPGPADGDIGAQLALGFFVGVRTAEMERLRWEDLDLGSKTLRIPFPKGHTAGMRPRIVELEPCAVAWLRLWRDRVATTATDGMARGMIIRKPWRLREWKAKWLEPSGDSWGNVAFHNVMRKTYATMHVAAFRDAAATALNLGHGRDSEMLERHYRGLVPRAVAVKFWRIFPAGRA